MHSRVAVRLCQAFTSYAYRTDADPLSVPSIDDGHSYPHMVAPTTASSTPNAASACAYDSRCAGSQYHDRHRQYDEPAAYYRSSSVSASHAYSHSSRHLQTASVPETSRSMHSSGIPLDTGHVATSMTNGLDPRLQRSRGASDDRALTSTAPGSSGPHSASLLVPASSIDSDRLVDPYRSSQYPPQYDPVSVSASSYRRSHDAYSSYDQPSSARPLAIIRSTRAAVAQVSAAAVLQATITSRPLLRHCRRLLPPLPPAPLSLLHRTLIAWTTATEPLRLIMDIRLRITRPTRPMLATSIQRMHTAMTQEHTRATRANRTTPVTLATRATMTDTMIGIPLRGTTSTMMRDMRQSIARQP
ncbi:hypothetical protein BC831DRAFT_62960 [Entophlyctis helioformis]|nr:hypothetical protein BC831DRAFT_62960 [Entophlyctis helioformis]